MKPSPSDTGTRPACPTAEAREQDLLSSEKWEYREGTIFDKVQENDVGQDGRFLIQDSTHVYLFFPVSTTKSPDVVRETSRKSLKGKGKTRPH